MIDLPLRTAATPTKSAPWWPQPKSFLFNSLFLLYVQRDVPWYASFEIVDSLSIPS